jgi:5-methylcytosine-specific restriction endonuclease McrA
MTTCRHCKKQFEATDRAYKRRTPKFCSPTCWYAWRRDNESIRLCAQCMRPFKRRRMGKLDAENFCSHRCILLSRGALRTCKVCGKEYKRAACYRRSPYCSWECYRTEHQSKIKPKACLHCQVEFVPRSLVRPMKFCSLACAVAHNRGERHPLYRGKRSADRGPDWKKISAAIRKRDDYTCQGCGEETGDKAHAVDHLVPYRIAKRIADKRPELDPNHPVNLLTLCMSCHVGKTHYERMLIDGDTTQFFGWAAIIVGKIPLREAMEYYGLWDFVVKSTTRKEGSSQEAENQKSREHREQCELGPAEDVGPV